MSARMGIFQEHLYSRHGKHSKEALFYIVSIHIFFCMYRNIVLFLKFGLNLSVCMDFCLVIVGELILSQYFIILMCVSLLFRKLNQLHVSYLGINLNGKYCSYSIVHIVIKFKHTCKSFIKALWIGKETIMSDRLMAVKSHWEEESATI